MHRDLTRLYRGDDRTILLHFKTRAGVDVPITGWTVFLTVKTNKSDLDAVAKLKKDVASHYAPTEGKTKIIITDTESGAITPGTYYYDIQIKKDTGEILTILEGQWEIKEDITRRTS